MKYISLTILLVFILGINLTRISMNENKPNKNKTSTPHKAAKTAAKRAQASLKKSLKKTQKLFALKSYTVSFILNAEEVGSGTFDIHGLTNPKGNQLLGFHFTLNKKKTPNQTFINLLVKEGDSFYLPYRIITSDITYVNPFGSAKSLEFFVTDLQDKVYKVIVRLPYASNKTFINDEEANALKGLLNTLVVNARVRLNNLKKAASIQVGNYINVKPFLVAAKKGDKALDDAITLANTDSEALTVVIKSDNEHFKEVRKEFETIEKQYFELKNKLNYYNDRVSESKNLRIAKMTWLNVLKNKKANDVKDKLKTEVKKNLAAVDLAFENLAKEIPGEAKSLNEIKKTVTEKLNIAAYVKSANKIYAGN